MFLQFRRIKERGEEMRWCLFSFHVVPFKVYYCKNKAKNKFKKRRSKHIKKMKKEVNIKKLNMMSSVIFFDFSIFFP